MGLCFLAHGFLHLESLRSLRTHRVRSDHLVCPALLELAEFAAWRIYALVKQGRETPDLPCDVYLAEEEWKVLHAWKKKAPPPDKPPPLREAVRWIASLGGFLGRKGDGDPGTTATWRGLERLSATVEGWQLYQTMHPARASP